MIVKRGNLFSPEAWNKQHLQFSLGTQEKLCTWLHESKRIPAGLLAMAAHSQPPVAWRAHLWPNEKKWNKWYGLDMVMAPQEKPGPVMCLVFWGVSWRMLRRGLWITKLTRLSFWLHCCISTFGRRHSRAATFIFEGNYEIWTWTPSEYDRLCDITNWVSLTVSSFLAVSYSVLNS